MGDQMIRAVLFDFDDTLVDTLNSKIPAIIEYCQTMHGRSVTAEMVKKLWGVPFVEMMRELMGEERVDFARYLSISEGYPLQPFPESEAVLNGLRSRMRIGIVTSLARPVLTHSLATLGWANDWFATLVAEGEAPAHKPDPRVFEPAMAALPDLYPQQVLYVGDGLQDARAAKGAGLRFIGVGRSQERQETFQREGFSVQASLAEIAAIVSVRSISPSDRSA